jgi:hypothetical protein
MTRAAEELAVSYPVVSKTISQLEQTLGVSDELELLRVGGEMTDGP